MYKSTVALALLVIEIVILIFYPKENKSKFFIYPQHWGFALITLAFILDASLVISRYIVQKNKKPGKVAKIQEGSLDFIPSPSVPSSVKIQIIGGKVYLRE